MSAFDAIAGFDLRDHALQFLDLVEIDTPDGLVGFLPGTDGKFTDLNGREWWGATVLQMGTIQSALDGVAPEGSITLAYFQDPSQPDLVAQIQALGSGYIDGRAIRFLIQPIRGAGEFYAPTTAPVQWCERTMRTLTFAESGAQDRSITLTFEAWSENRRLARRIRFDRAGHETVLGAANPSLQYRPTDGRQDEKLFG